LIYILLVPSAYKSIKYKDITDDSLIFLLASISRDGFHRLTKLFCPGLGEEPQASSTAI